LEIGCGDGTLWIQNLDRLPANVSVTLSDISEGMIRDVRRSLESDSRFDFADFDCHNIPYEAESFDLVIANHMLFYCEDISQVLRECHRVLKNGGQIIASTYGTHHMQEITALVQEFDKHIQLSADKLYDAFGLENGEKQLSEFFHDVHMEMYEDSLNVDKAEVLIEYILSCHGNQNRYLLDRYQDFRKFVEKKTKKVFHITKEAGVFVGSK
jgi:ubiquinone/menaquinone biosynthesis C-methylase UbiE